MKFSWCREVLLFLALALIVGCSEDSSPSANGGSGGDEDTSQADIIEGDSQSPGEGDGQGEEEIKGAYLRFDPAGESFFDLPFPSDERLGEDGSVDFRQWERAYKNDLLKLWLDAGSDLMQGWGLLSGVFIHFNEPIDPESLPASLEESALGSGEAPEKFPSVFLMNVDPDSPDQGETLPIECKFNREEGSYHDANLLGCISPFGIVRAPNTRYALVVTSELKDADGAPVVGDRAMQRLLAGEDVEGAEGLVSAEPYKAARDLLVDAGMQPEDIAAAVLFTTGNPASRLVKINQWYRQLDEPKIDAESLSFVEEFDDYIVLRGTYQTPIIQQGELPFSRPPAGKVVFDERGEPEVQSYDTVPFLLTIPTGEMPAVGWPIMMYMHGSGGQMQELVDRGARTDAGDADSAPRGSGPGGVVAPYGVAGFAAEFAFHGTRFNPPDTLGLQLYNLFENPRAAIDNFITAANEVTLHARLLKGLEIDPAALPELAGRLDVEAAPDGLIRFDDARISAMGQSMGSTIGLPALTVSQDIAAGVLSGSGATLIEVALKTMKPVELKPLILSLLRYKRSEEMDKFDLILSALQHTWDFVDPSVHARYAYQEPHPQTPAKHILQHLGMEDGYFSVYSRTALTGALGIDVAEPVLEPEVVDIMEVIAPAHSAALPTPVQGNLAEGQITGVAAIYEPSVMDGHNVAYQVEDAKAQYGCFVKSVGPDGPPTFRSVAESQVDSCEE